MIHPAPFDPENFDRDVHQLLEFGKEPLVISLRLVCRTGGAVDREDLPRTHREMFAVGKQHLVIKLIVLVCQRRELVGTALVTRDALPPGPPRYAGIWLS